jgi:lipopolysaccharide biosynthesis glycosyltransferase
MPWPSGLCLRTQSVIDIFVGYDEREAVAYHTFCQSVIENTRAPVRFTPLVAHGIDGQKDGSNSFVYSRFLVPYLMGYKGWAIFADGDMVVNADITELWHLRDSHYALQVVKHDYKTKHPIKYLGNKNEDYPRKNWSSLMLWNCEHEAHRHLDKYLVEELDGKYLHRFEWLKDNEIGSLPLYWNWLAMEYPSNQYAKLIHYTIGTPCFEDYKDCEMSEFWWSHYAVSQHGIGE